jgi:hypothetical protein
MTKHKSILVKGTEITLMNKEDNSFIPLTDIAKNRNQSEPFAIINNWMRSRSTIEFPNLLKKLRNIDFKPLEFERFRNETGFNNLMEAI